MKTIRIALLVLIIIGIGLLVTQKIWVPKLVDKIVSSDTPSEIIPAETKDTSTPPQANSPKNSSLNYDKASVLRVFSQNSLFPQYSSTELSNKVVLAKAKDSGTGKAWFFTGEDMNANTSGCPAHDGTAYIKQEFEMNAGTGTISMTNSCAWK